MDQPVHVNPVNDGVLPVALSGEIDLTNSSVVAHTVRSAVDRARPEVVRLDLAEVTFLDSSGIGVLVTAYKTAQAVGARYRVVGPSKHVYEQLRLTGLVDLFGIDPPRIPVR